jgi:hypothetical protein
MLPQLQENGLHHVLRVLPLPGKGQRQQKHPLAVPLDCFRIDLLIQDYTTCLRVKNCLKRPFTYLTPEKGER